MLRVRELERGSAAREYADAHGIGKSGTCYMPCGWHEDDIELAEVRPDGLGRMHVSVKQERMKEIFDSVE